MSNILNNRIIHGDNGTLKDLGIILNDFSSGTELLPIVAADDFLYLGAPFPFNHRWFELGVANDQASVVSVDVWDGDTWEPTVEVIDETKNTSGQPLASSGMISWVPDKEEGWLRDDTNGTSTNDPITGLEDKIIYDLYWARLSFSADLNALTALKYVGQRFSIDNDLRIDYPDLLDSDVLDRYESGKTNWDEQHFRASERVVADLIGRLIVKSGNEVLNWQLFREASTHKVAEMIFKGMGNDFNENRQSALDDYDEALKRSIFEVDRNRDGRINPTEKSIHQGWFTR